MGGWGHDLKKYLSEAVFLPEHYLFKALPCGWPQSNKHRSITLFSVQ
jgi:hypothetical protein